MEKKLCRCGHPRSWHLEGYGCRAVAYKKSHSGRNILDFECRDLCREYLERRKLK